MFLSYTLVQSLDRKKIILISINGAAAYQLGNTNSRMITEVKQR